MHPFVIAINEEVSQPKYKAQIEHDLNMKRVGHCDKFNVVTTPAVSCLWGDFKVQPRIVSFESSP